MLMKIMDLAKTLGRNKRVAPRALRGLHGRRSRFVAFHSEGYAGISNSRTRSERASGNSIFAASRWDLFFIRVKRRWSYPEWPLARRFCLVIAYSGNSQMIWPVPGSRLIRVAEWLKSKNPQSEPALTSLESPPTRGSFQLSSMKRITEDWSVMRWSM